LWCLSSFFFHVFFSGVFFCFAHAFSRANFLGGLLVLLFVLFLVFFLCGLLFLVWVAKEFFLTN
jgi:hypothetical protein